MGRSLIRKMDQLDQMMQSMEAPYRKKRRYYGLLEEEISKNVRAYISGLEKGTVTVLEKLDIREFKKSRKLNGKLSTFARGEAPVEAYGRTEHERVCLPGSGAGLYQPALPGLFQSGPG